MTSATKHETSPSTSNWSLVALTPALGKLSVSIGKSLSLGRSHTNDVVLASPQISRQHAKINRIGEHLYVQDLGSANGTFVNDERISTEAVHIEENDELAFADLLFMLTNDEAVLDDASASIAELDEAIINEITPVTTAPQISKQVDAGSQSDEAVAALANSQTDSVPVTNNVLTEALAVINETDTGNSDTQSKIYQINTSHNSTTPTVEPSKPTNMLETAEKSKPTSMLSQDLETKETKMTQPTIQQNVNQPLAPSTVQASKPISTSAKKSNTMTIVIVIIILLMAIAAMLLR